MPDRRTTAPRLSRELILDAYLRLVETVGGDKVTLRHLGRELGADSTAVYRHFRSKNEILAAAADRLLAEVTEGVPATGSWRGQLRALLLALRRAYLVHPQALLALALHLSPPVLQNGFSNVERSLGLLREAGVPEDQVPIAYEALETYVIGTTVVDARATEASLARWRAVYSALPPDRFPHLVATASSLYLDVDQAFCFGLDLMLDAIEAGVAARAASQGNRTQGRPAARARPADPGRAVSAGSPATSLSDS